MNDSPLAHQRPPESDNFFIVGIGASAGGVQALESFFANISNDTNAAFVVVQHLSPNHKSMMTEILQRRTQMTVQTAQDQMEMTAGTIYLLPPGKSMTVEDGHLCLQDRVDGAAFDYPINRFFKSLAKDWKERAIAILLSGTGKDGTEGLQAVSRAGGIALVQSPETAQFTSMPTNAIPSGLVDEVLSPQDLAQTVFELIRLAENFPASSPEEASLIDPDKLQRILDILAKNEDIDFSHYKVSTLSRRIHHRCALTRQSTLDHYIRLLEGSEDEQKMLRQDLLIGATSFFRDPPAWEFLEEEVLPSLLDKLQPDQQFRVWVTACATGEEAYSMAILIDEAMQRLNKPVQVKIFVTDLDNNALEVAAQGKYSDAIATSVSPERLERYFDHHEGHYQVKRALREMLIIAPHDLTKNAGFSKMNLVSCRNVLIYMQPQLQQQVLRLLHFALAPQGVLFLGSSETLGNLESEFEVLNPKWKIFAKRRDTQFNALPVTRQSILPNLSSRVRSKPRRNQTNRTIGEAFRYCLGDRQMTCLLVNHDNRLQQVFYNSANLLQFPVGEALLDVTEIVHSELRLPLSTALHRTKRDREPVLYSGIRVDQNGEEITVSLRVGLDQSNPAAADRNLIVVLEVEQAVPEETPTTRQFDMDSEASQQITELEYELQQTRENLQVTIEELETTNEEQQATNEELLASNEELQSTNEELQSVNEELYTVNSEYQSKIQELTQLNNDIDNLLRSTNLGVLFLDHDLNIRKFTPAATQAINIKPSDFGRPIADLTNNLDCPNFVDIIQSVIDTKEPVEQEVRLTSTNQIQLMRVNPYMRDGDGYEGVVLTFVNIHELKQAQKHLQQANDALEKLYTTSPAGHCLLDKDFRFVRINQTLADVNGASIEEHVGRTVDEMLPDLAPKLRPYFQQVLDHGEVIHQVDISGTTPQNPDEERTWLASYYPLEFAEGDRGIGAVVIDVTHRLRAEADLRDKELKLREAQRLALLGNWEISAIDGDDLVRVAAEWSPELYEITGFDPNQPPPPLADLLDYHHPDDREKLRHACIDLMENGTPQELDLRFYRPDGEMRYFHWLGRALRDDQGQLVKCYGVLMDITDRKMVETELLRQKRELEDAIAVAQEADSANQAKSEFLSNMSHEIRTPLNSILGAGQLLNRSDLSKSQQQLLNLLTTNSRKLLALVNDILSLSKIEARQLTLDPAPFQMDDLIRQLKQEFEVPAQEKNLRLDFSVSDTVPDRVIGDQFRLQQILSNLLSNAIKFTHEGGITVTVSPLPSDPQDKKGGTASMLLYFNVQDTGIGVADEHRESIFEPFSQADGSMTRRYGGTGLGLAICRRLVELMDGRIGVDSRLDHGSSFWFTVSLGVPPSAAIAPGNRPTSSRHSSLDASDRSSPDASDDHSDNDSDDDSQEIQSTMLKGLKILIVEDQVDNRFLLIQILERCDCRIDFAEDGQQALDKLAKRDFDMVLMDCQLPVVDGFEATRRLRAQENQEGNAKHTTVIGVTAYAMVGDRERCLDAGMDDYVSKPIMINDFLQVLERHAAQLQH